MLQGKISHMFDNSAYSNCNIHRKLQQALAQVLESYQVQQNSCNSSQQTENKQEKKASV